MGAIIRQCIAVAVTAGLLAGCAGGKRKPIASVSKPAAKPSSMPRPPMGATAGMTIPAVGKDGQRITPNRELSEAATLWHVRMALNVAALSCLKQDAARVQYNQLLNAHKTILAKTNKAVDAEYKERLGSKGVDARDRLNTRVYNFFALPPVQERFCDRAIVVGRAANARKSSELSAYAPEAIASLEAPFLEFYDAYAVYQVRLAAWRKEGRQELSAR
ncbi:hypothetical protein [Sphingobium phenoxybenzoativorans]|uniref:hypothetical protein n=1 Tax=Sphingobium phenoxybenzoativorans TaxID=1592790 RepID=UPI000872F8A0|nr:hypothetical protein [Sphingobium phenoxybenzoativorans]